MDARPHNSATSHGLNGRLAAGISDDTLVCNCCECHCELIGRSNTPEVLAAAREQHLPIVACRLADGERNKPYCLMCLYQLVPAINTYHLSTEGKPC
jgi:hypothetical protein